MLRNSLKRIKLGIVLGAAVLGCGGAVFSFIQKADAALMLDWVVGSDGVIYDEAYRALGSTFNQQGKLLSFRVLVPGVGTGQRNTSATFLNRWYALTAAHNVRDLLQYNPTYEVATGDNYLTNRGDVYPVESVTMFPGYDGTLWTPDIAIIRFAQPILGFSENTIGSASPGDVVTAAGYGWSATPSTAASRFRDGAARGWEAAVWDQPPSGNISSIFYVATTFGFRNDGLLLNGSGLSGDSGGPVFNATNQLVGILVASSGIVRLAETDYLRLADSIVYSWILENTSLDIPAVVTSGVAVRRNGTARRIR